MKRTLPILGWMLFGAVAATTGSSFFLWRTNHDRQLLGTALAQCQTDTKQLGDERIRAAYEERLRAAEDDLTRAKTETARLQREAKLRELATPLPSPTSARLRGWHEVASVGLGAALRLPPPATFRIADDVLTSQITMRSAQGMLDEQWLYVGAYRADRAMDIEQRITSPLEVSYTVRNLLFTGTKGVLPDGRRIYALALQQHGAPTHLLWLMPSGTITEEMLLEVLGTLTISPKSS